MIDLRVGDCLDVFGAEPDESLDAIVQDWPAGVAFMGRAWDRSHGGRDAWVKVWAERAAVERRKSKPGAYSLTWALPRTAHWTACALDDAGWQIQDVIVHVFGQGWPKGRSALKPASEHWILARNGSGGSLQIDAARVARGDAIRPFGTPQKCSGLMNTTGEPREQFQQDPAGSWPPNFMLSHCHECEERGVRRVGSQARLTEESVATKACGYGGSNHEGRVKKTPGLDDDGWERDAAFDCLAACDCGASVLAPAGGAAPRCAACGALMWWACPVAEMDAQSGERRSTLTGRADPNAAHAHPATARPACFFGQGNGGVGEVYADSGGASRFFPRFTYAAKAAGGERDAGCEELYWRREPRSPFGFVRVSREEWEGLPDEGQRERLRARGNVHPTVKSRALMRHLVALVTPPGGRVGDATVGSGGTALAVLALNEVARALPQPPPPMSMLGCDICPEAIEIARARVAWWSAVRLDAKPTRKQEDGAPVAQQDLFAQAVPRG